MKPILVDEWMREKFEGRGFLLSLTDSKEDWSWILYNSPAIWNFESWWGLKNDEKNTKILDLTAQNGFGVVGLGDPESANISPVNAEATAEGKRMIDGLVGVIEGDLVLKYTLEKGGGNNPPLIG